MAKSQEEKLDELLSQFAEEARKKFARALKSGNVPEEWLSQDNYLPQKAALDSLCRDRPFHPKREYVADFSNIHMVI